MKKIFLYVISFFVIICLAVFAISFLYKDALKAKLLAELDSKINADINFNDFTLSPFRNFPHVTVGLSNFLVIGRGQFLNDSLAYADKLLVSFDVFSILRGNDIEIKSIHLEKPVVQIEVLPDGRANYDLMPQSGSKKDQSAFNINIDHWEIIEGKITYDNKQQVTQLSMLGVNHSGKGDFDLDISDLSVATTVDQLSYSFQGIKYLDKKHFVTDLTMEMNLKDYIFTFKDHKLELNHFKVGFDGSFQILKEGFNIDFGFTVKDTQFKNLLSVMPGFFMDDFKNIKTNGEFSLNGYVKGVYDNVKNIVPNFFIDLKIERGLFQYTHLPKPVENIDLHLTLENESGKMENTVLNVLNFHADLDKNPFHGRLKITGLTDKHIDTEIKANLDLADLEKLFPLPDIELKGILSVDIKAKGKLDDSLKTLPIIDSQIKIEKGSFKYKYLPKPVENINLHLTLQNENGTMESTVLNVLNFHADLDKNPFHGRLKITGLRDKHIDTEIKASLDLADLEKLFPLPDIELKGILNVDIKAKGKLDDSLKTLPVIDSRITLTGGFIKDKQYPVPMENIQIETEIINTSGKPKETEINLNQMTYTLDGEQFKLKGSVKNLIDYNYNIEVDGNVDLEKISKIYPLPGIDLKGLINFDITSSGKFIDLENQQFAKISNSGTIKVSDLMMRDKDVKKDFTVSDALIRLFPDRITIDHWKMKAGKSNVELSGHLFDYYSIISNTGRFVRGDLKMTCDSLDINEWMSPSEVKPSDTTKSTLKIIEIPRAIDFTFDSDISNVHFGELNINKLDGEIKIKDGILTLHEAGFDAVDASFSVSGDYNTQDMNHPKFDLVIDIDKLDINKAYKTFPSIQTMAPAAENAYGVFKSNYKLRGELAHDFQPIYESIIGNGVVKIDDAKLMGMTVMSHISKLTGKNELSDPTAKDIVIESEIKGGKLLILPFTFKLGKYLTSMEGTYSFSNEMDYIIHLSVPPINKLRIPFHITGTPDKMSVKLGKGHEKFDFSKME